MRSSAILFKRNNIPTNNSHLNKLILNNEIKYKNFRIFLVNKYFNIYFGWFVYLIWYWYYIINSQLFEVEHCYHLVFHFDSRIRLAYLCRFCLFVCIFHSFFSFCCCGFLVQVTLLWFFIIFVHSLSFCLFFLKIKL